VREALKELIAHGIVAYKPQIGNFIAILSGREIADAYATRGVLEAYAAMTTRRRFTAEDFHRLQLLVERMRDYAQRGDKKMVVEVGDSFHRLLTAKNDNRQLAEYMDRLSLKLHVMFCRHWSDLYSPEEIGDRHLRIVTTLAEGDPDLIEATIRDHYRESGDKIAALYQENCSPCEV
jgi:DNA-binding GntR family transcriptional regulator